jgi:hypothetical protein
MIRQLDLAVMATDKVLHYLQQALLLGVKRGVPEALCRQVSETESRLKVERQRLMKLYLEVRTHLEG